MIFWRESRLAHRTLPTLALLMVIGSAFAVVAQTNPVPLINQPLSPASVAPGSKKFTLKVRGTGFAAGAVLNWNGSPRITILDSGSHLRAKINASDVAKAGTAIITVVNPGPGGGTSNTVPFSVRRPFSTAAFSRRDYPLGSRPSGGVLAAGDFNNDRNLDVVAGNKNGRGFQVFPGTGDGRFGAPVITHSHSMYAMLVADVNGDGNLDLIVGDPNDVDFPPHFKVFLGDGTGHFAKLPSFGDGSWSMAAADFNGDGKLDFFFETGAHSDDTRFGIYLGEGDGTFTLGTLSDYLKPSQDVAVGDFNGDSALDLAIADELALTVNVFLGNGDGTFQSGRSYATTTYADTVVTGDVNQDGKLDLITNGISVLLGNGDGTFRAGQSIDLATANGKIALADIDGDGQLDLILTAVQYSDGHPTNLELLLGNGDGTFNTPLNFSSGYFGESLTIGDFNGDGMLDAVNENYSDPNAQQAQFSLFLQTPASVSPSSLDFGKQQIGLKSPAQVVTLKNIGLSALPINGIHIKGADAKDFSQTNKCGAKLPAGASCKVKVFFKPQQTGVKSASLKIDYGAAGSPQLVLLSGTAIDLQVSLTPPQLTFPLQLVGTQSTPQTATLKNLGTETVTISKITTSGPFTQSNNCGGSLNPGASCQIQVQFVPTAPGDANGTLTVTDDAPDSPQTVVLSGTGTIVKISPISINFGNQPVGTTSPSVPVTLTNKGDVTLNISDIGITGANASDFAQTNNCGNSVPAGGSCKIKVTFTPAAQGARTATLSITDDGGGSPQTVALSGTGT